MNILLLTWNTSNKVKKVELIVTSMFRNKWKKLFENIIYNHSFQGFEML